MMNFSIWWQAAVITFRETWLILLLIVTAAAVGHVMDYMIIRHRAFRVARERQRRERAALSRKVEMEINEIERAKEFREFIENLQAAA